MARCYFNLLVTAAHGATAFGKPTNVSFQETMDWAVSRAGGEQGPACRSVQTYDVTATATYNVFVTPLVKSTTKASFTYTAKDNEGATATFTIANTKIGEVGGNQGNAIGEYTQQVVYEGTSIDPISVSG